MEGWICLHRKILENPIICKDSDYFSIFSYLLLSATHEDRTIIFNNNTIILKKGQLITGRKKISDKFNISESKVQRVLKKLEIEQVIEQQTSSKNRLITVINWYKYQSIEQQNKQQLNNKRTTSEQQVNTNNNETIEQLNNIKEIYKEKYFESEKLNTCFLEWLSYKKQKKEKYTEIGLKKLVTQINNNLKNNTEEQMIELIDTCMSRNYKGIIFDMLPKEKDIPDWVGEM